MSKKLEHGKPLMSQDEMMKRVNAAVIKSRAQVAKDLKEAKREAAKVNGAGYYAKRVKRLENELKGFNSLPGIPFRVRSGLFRGSANRGGRSGNGPTSGHSHGLDVTTGRAHSYEWYDLGRVIKGQYVVNSYGYSNQTTQHYYALKHTLEMLGIKFIEIEAPRGLQNLSSAADYYLGLQAKAMVSAKHAQKKNVESYNDNAAHYAKQVARVKTLGAKPTHTLKDCISVAESARETKIENARCARERAETKRQSGLIQKYAKQVVLADIDASVVDELVKLGRLSEAEELRAETLVEGYSYAVRIADLRRQIELIQELTKIGKLEAAQAQAETNAKQDEQDAA